MRPGGIASQRQSDACFVAFPPRKSLLSKWQLVLPHEPLYAVRQSYARVLWHAFLSAVLRWFCFIHPVLICIWSACRALRRIWGPVKRSCTSPSRFIWPGWPQPCCLLAVSPTSQAVSRWRFSAPLFSYSPPLSARRRRSAPTS